MLVLVISVALFIFVAFRKFEKRWQKILLLLISVCLIGVTGFQYLFPYNPALSPTGQQRVVNTAAFYSHKTAFSDMRTNDEEREVPVKVWYPKEAKDRSQPLVVFSHGAFGVAGSNETLFLELASRGYVVVSIAHPYQSLKTILSDGRRIHVNFKFIQDVTRIQSSKDLDQTWSTLDKYVQLWGEDMDFVLDELLDQTFNNEFEKLINPQKVVVAGHSLGGSTALAVGNENAERIRGVIALESPYVHNVTKVQEDQFVYDDSEYPLPILHVYSDTIYPSIAESVLYAENYKVMQKPSSRIVNRHIAGVGHSGLTDLSLITPTITNLIDGGANTREPEETLSELNGYVVDFLATYNE